VVGIVIVSHSGVLAEGVVALAREMGGEELALEPAGGLEEEGVLGTDPERVRAAIERAMSPDGVLVMMDLGSALMSAEFAVELLGDAPGPVRLSEAPLVEGAVAAAVAARSGASLQEVAAEARGALAMKSAQLGVSEDGAGTTAVGAASDAGFATDASATLVVRNEIGLHARPAARFVEIASGFDADVRVAKGPDGELVSARSLTNVVALGARFGDTVLVRAAGPQAAEVVAALESLAAEGFGDGVSARGVPGGAGAAAGAGAPGAVAGASGASGASGADAAGVAAASEVVPAPGSGETLTGVPASLGIAVGPVVHLRGSLVRPPDHDADSPAAERERLEQARGAAGRAIVGDRDAVAARAGEGDAAIFDAHRALLDDEALLEPASAAIDGGASAERAVYDAVQQLAARYRAFEEPLLRERAVDVLDVGRRLLDALTGGDAGGAAGLEGIVVAAELTPADTAGLDPERVSGIATARGTATAHAAILARGLGLPAVVGLGDAVLGVIEGTRVLLDGETGTLLVDPAEDVVSDALERRERAERRRALAHARAREAGQTRDGRRVEVFANLGSAAEAPRAVELGAEGVGLLRTEFLFLDRRELPDEDEQAQTLREIARALDGRTLIVRTLDAGADKPLPALPMPPEVNPFLGVRGIRLALRRREVLATQLRAILRVAAEHPLKVMLPMVATLEELRAARAVLADARVATGVDAELELGIMVEVPAAALTAVRLAEEAEFFSLGTNDLTQYTMAAERGDERLAPLLTGPQPAVLRLVRETVQAAAARGRMVGVCGELAGDPAAAILLAGLGVSELSMAPALVPEVKAALREVDFATAEATALAALDADDAEAARALASALL
jgi:phosphocarrier protein FPr